MRRVARLWPVLLLLVPAAALFFGLRGRLSFEQIAAHQHDVRAVIAAHPVLAPLAYLLLYALLVAFSVPGASALSVAAGALFGVPLGAAVVVSGAGLGAALAFLLARAALGRWVARRAGPLLDRVRPVLERDGFPALLAMRLLPVVPFWLVNLASALAGVRLLPFVLATFLGITPAAFVFVSTGAGLGGALASGVPPGPGLLLRPGVLLPLLGLALLALAPAAWRRRRERRDRRKPPGVIGRLTRRVEHGTVPSPPASRPGRRGQGEWRG